MYASVMPLPQEAITSLPAASPVVLSPCDAAKPHALTEAMTAKAATRGFAVRLQCKVLRRWSTTPAT